MFEDINELWISDWEIGRLKRGILVVFQRLYGFGEWHLAPINERPYAQYVVRSINTMISDGIIRGNIVEVGCGVGEIIGNIRAKKINKHGYDIERRQVNCARLLHPFTAFDQGSFLDVKERKIDILICINLIHLIPYVEMKEYINGLLENSEIKFILIDTFRNSSYYRYSHDIGELFGDEYRLVRRKGIRAAYGERRIIELWEKKESI